VNVLEYHEEEKQRENGVTIWRYRSECNPLFKALRRRSQASAAILDKQALASDDFTLAQ
jgi:hypothetical protein